MSKTHCPTTIGLQKRNDALAAYRRRVMLVLAALAVPVLMPFAIHHFRNENLLIGMGMLFSMLVLTVDALAMHFRRHPPLPLPLILLPSLGAMAIAIKTQGFFGALWSYPIVLLFHFTMSRRLANAACLLQLVTVSLLTQRYVGAAEAIRFCATLSLTIILINIAISIVDDLHRRLLTQSIVDPLTGTYNRHHMENCLDYAIDRSRRCNAPASLLLMHIDHFKQINDRHGHATGDEVLREVAQAIRSRIRKLDLLFRLGGEEFLVLLPDTEESDAARLAEDLRTAISHCCLMQGHHVTMSIGISELQAQDSRKSWLAHADDALYLAKEMGHDRVVRRNGLYLLKSGRA